ncbi:MAG: hypothetical protein E7148_07795 [Rikenellaceae bacterium]|nr:hypothetical protein [Rikenellaceae bacterium]
MKKYLLLYAVIITAMYLCIWHNQRSEIQRLTQNQQALSAETLHYRTLLGEEVASTQALRLRCAEFERLRTADAKRIRSLGIKLRRMESMATTASVSSIDIQTPIHDTVVVRIRDTLLVRDTIRLFRWADRWVTVEGLLTADSVSCHVTSIDTLRQIAHRIPRRFLFFRWGTKAIRQEIVSTNPHTRVVYADCIKIERK